ncbi:MAG: hemin uptake protein HemP [Pseudomonadota bacterium]
MTEPDPCPDPCLERSDTAQGLPQHTPEPNPMPKPNPMIDSQTLLGGASTVLIRHGAELYTLRQTRAGKLILTK